MLEALVKGKLSQEQENMEDILTSNVFGLLKYLPPRILLFPFLKMAKTINGVFPLEEIPDDLSFKFKFWRPLHEKKCYPCEPDLLIDLFDNDGRTIYSILIEAKYHSGKSSFADDSEFPNDQLAKEFDNLQKYSESKGSTPVLIYLTTDYGFPKNSIEESISEYHDKRGQIPTLAWLSWQHLNNIINVKSGEELYSQIIKDLSNLLKKLNLTFFSGLPVLDVYDLGWKFKKIWNLIISRNKIGWHFIKKWNQYLFIPGMKWKFVRFWDLIMNEFIITWRFRP